jgi:hypothetical protein
LTSTLTGSGQGWLNREGSGAEALSDDVWKERTKRQEGHVYLFDSWEREARIISTQGNELMLRNINFNVEENRFETETFNDSTFIFHNSKIKTVELITGETFIKMVNPNTNKETFFETLIVSNKISFYKTPELLIARGVLNPLTQESEPDVISNRPVYFYTKDNSNLIEFDLKRKSILTEFSDKKDEISDFVKEKKLKYGDEKDVVKILKYYNSL